MSKEQSKAIKQLRTEIEPFELQKEEAEALVSIAKYLSGESEDTPVRTIAIRGGSGNGKTYLANAVAKAANASKILLTANRITDKDSIIASDLTDLLAKISPGKPIIVIIDPIELFLDEKPFHDSINEESLRKEILALDTIRQTPRCAGIIITSKQIDDSIKSKIDLTLKLILPRDRLKTTMIRHEYPGIGRKHTEMIAGGTLGYNLHEIKQATARMLLTDRGKLTDSIIAKTLKHYTPSSLSNFNLVTNIQSSLADIIGKDHIKEKLRRATKFMERTEELRKKGIKRPNIFVFYGPPGTGKTHTARALAGELQWPFIHIDMQKLHDEGPVLLQDALKSAKRFRRCIVFVDDADILVGHEALERDGINQGAIISTLDGIDGVQEGIVILAMNNKDSFGPALYDRAVSIYFDKPNKKERTCFFEEKKQLGTPACPEKLGQLTEGMSYRQLEKIWDDIAFEHIANDEKGEPAFEEIIQRHKARVTPTMFG